MAPLAFRRCRALLGTFIEVALPEMDAALADEGFAAIARVHAAMSFHDEGSDLAALRRAPVGEAVQVLPDTVAVLRLAERLRCRSGGLFDVTVGRALVADGFLPRPAGIDLRRIAFGAEAIEVLDDAHVRCLRPLLIDLGGIAKGFAVDRAIEALAAAGARRALVNAGGDLRVLGDAPEPVYLRTADGRIGGQLMLADGALASSSNLHDRRRSRGQIAVPHRGLGGIAVAVDEAVSVLAPTCASADAMTKIALVDPALAAAMLAEEGGAIVRRPASRLAA